jgi:hypothetical protein
MADTGIFATTAEVGYKAGLTASATSIAEAYINSYMTQVESFINVACKYNFSDKYATLNVDVKGILKECASNLAAIYCIEYDMSGATATTLERLDSEDKINILYKRAMDCLKILQDKDIQTWMIGA